MARLPRRITAIAGLSIHKVWRGHNKEWNIQSETEKCTYLSFLNEEIIKQRSPLEALCLMSNHSHEIYHLEELEPFSNFLRVHHSRYGMYFNKKHSRCGKVAQDRPFTSSIEENDAIEMEVLFYVHANPLRAGICKDAKDYMWSTHRLYGYGKRLGWMKNIVFPGWYMRLGKTMKDRQRRYRKLFDQYLREKGFIKKPSCAYGTGSLLWVHKQREEILKKLKNVSSTSPPG